MLVRRTCIDRNGFSKVSEFKISEGEFLPLEFHIPVLKSPIPYSFDEVLDTTISVVEKKTFYREDVQRVLEITYREK